MLDNNDTHDKRLLIITGPQGSGNHLFSRLLSLHPDVSGWEELKQKYWVPSDLEPFADYWVNPESLSIEKFNDYQYHLANVSCPFMYDGIRYVPKILEVAERSRQLGIDVQIAIIVRDQNINAEQQRRVRGEVTTPIAQNYYYNTLLKSNFPVHFLDHEAFFLHQEHYLKWIAQILNFPIELDPVKINQFIDKDANHKYVKYVDEYWLDQEVWAGIQSKAARGLKSS
jgi:hypothetical protein